MEDWLLLGIKKKNKDDYDVDDDDGESTTGNYLCVS